MYAKEILFEISPDEILQKSSVTLRIVEKDFKTKLQLYWYHFSTYAQCYKMWTYTKELKTFLVSIFINNIGGWMKDHKTLKMDCPESSHFFN